MTDKEAQLDEVRAAAVNLREQADAALEAGASAFEVMAILSSVLMPTAESLPT